MLPLSALSAQLALSQWMLRLSALSGQWLL
jgi:hypothetical protein